MRGRAYSVHLYVWDDAWPTGPGEQALVRAVFLRFAVALGHLSEMSFTFVTYRHLGTHPDFCHHPGIIAREMR